MSTETRHLTQHIDRSPTVVYEYAADPANLQEWAAGLSDSFQFVDGQWVADSPGGRILVEFSEPNNFGVLDHWVTDPRGLRVYNPLRVIADGDGSEVVFTLRRREGMSDDDLEADAAAVAADLATLRAILER